MFFWVFFSNLCLSVDFTTEICKSAELQLTSSVISETLGFTGIRNHKQEKPLLSQSLIPHEDFRGDGGV